MRIIQDVKKRPRNVPLWRVNGDQLYKRANLKYPNLIIHPKHNWLLVIPKENWQEIISSNHDSPTCGHLGVYKTLECISAEYYCPKMKVGVSKLINRCRICLETKPEQKNPIGLIISKTYILPRPWQLLSVNTVGPLPRTSSGFCYILSLYDLFSKFCLFLPMRKNDNKTIVHLLE